MYVIDHNEWPHYTHLTVIRDKEHIRSRIQSLKHIVVGALIGRGWGDQLQITPILRALKEEYPDKDITLLTYHPELFVGNPRPRFVRRVAMSVSNNVGALKRLLNGEETFGMVPVAFQHYWDEVPKPTTTAYGWQVGLDVTDTKQEFYLQPEELEFGENLRKELLGSRAKGYITIQSRCDPPAKFYSGCTGEDRWMSKTDWEQERWEPVAQSLSAMGYTPAQIGCLGDPKIESCSVDLREIGIRKTAAAIKFADLNICFDSLPMFLANAVGTHSVVLWGGRTRPAWTALKGRTDIDLSKGMEHSECWIPSTRNDPCKYDRACMKKITPEIVLAAVEACLAGEDL